MKLPVPARLVLLSLLVGLLLPACGLAPAVPIAPTVPPLDTATPQPSPSLTPFQPIEPTATSTATSTETPTATPIPTETSTPYPTPAPADRTQYTLYAVLDYGARRLEVEQRIRYTNHTGAELDRLVLAVEPNRWEGRFELHEMAANGRPVDEFDLDGHRLEISLPARLAKGRALDLTLVYTIDIPPGNNSYQVYGASRYQVNLVNWYPFVVPYHPQNGWVLHEPKAFGEHLVYETADFEVYFRLEQPGEGVAVAASAPAEQAGEWTRYRMERARTFAMAASTHLLVETAMAGEVQLYSYFHPDHRYGGRGLLQYMAEALEVFTQVYGPYPHDSLSAVEINFGDGMEYEGLFFMSRNFYNEYNGTVRGNLAVIGLHEVAHQWWFGRVGNDQALEPWLDEALSTYSERIFFERRYPNALNWWWSFRVDFFEPQGWVDWSIYDGTGFRPYTNAVYLRGARFLEELRGRVGDEIFFDFLKDYARRMDGRQASAGDFFAILREHSEAEIGDILKRYFLKVK